jgi:hypothetical protein
MASKKDDSAPASRFVGAGAFRVVDLKYPVEFDGKVYDKITVRRMTMKEMREFVEAVGEGKAAQPPVTDCPSDLLDHLYPDDYEEVDKAISDFLPRALKEVFARVVEAGEPTPPSSPPNSDGAPTSSSDSSGTTPSSGTTTP